MERADNVLVTRAYAKSRTKAQELIRGGLVRCEGKIVSKPSEKIDPEAAIEVLGELYPYVSRGGLKLEKALAAFEVKAEDRVCVDVGASTGGFTDVLCRNGARLVYAVDVGTSQLDDSLRSDPRVVSMENRNAREMGKEWFHEQPTLAVMDVSFISIRLIFPALFKVLGEEGELISLIKPQFETGGRSIGKSGVVTDIRVQEDVLRNVGGAARELGWEMDKLTYSPIRGSSGNIEFLAHFKAGASNMERFSREDIRELVRLAHRDTQEQK